MQVPVYENGCQMGTLEAQRQGLYTRFFCCLRGQRLCRVFGVFEDGERSLGIPVPEGQNMVLRVSVPTSRLPAGQLLSGEIREKDDGWRRFPGGTIGNISYPAGLRRENLYRFPWREGEPLPAGEALCFYRLVTEQAGTFLELRLSPEGIPVLPE